MLIEEHDSPSRLEVNDACKKLESFLDFYTKHKEHQKRKPIVGEMGHDFYTASGSS